MYPGKTAGIPRRHATVGWLHGVRRNYSARLVRRPAPARSAQRAHNVKSTTPGRRSTPGGTTWLRALLHPRAVLLQRGPSPRKFTLLHVRTSMVRKTSWPLPARTRPCESSDYSASKCANGHIILYRAAHYPGVLRLGWGAGAWRILWGEGGPKKICVCLRP